MRFLFAALASVLALLAPVAVFGRPSAHLDVSMSEDVLENLFSSWMKQYAKTYSFSEVSDRFMKFKANVAAIREHNMKGDTSYQLGLNQFADLSAAEFENNFLGFKRSEREASSSKKLHRCLASDVPSSIDWRTHGAVSPVMDQSSTANPWAFAAAGAIEGAWVLQGNHSLVTVSPQELAECCGTTSADDDFKCAIQAGGVCSVYSTNQCASCQRVVTISGYTDVASGDEVGLLNAVGTVGPVAVAVEADQLAFQFYTTGVFSATCGTQVDHGMLVVGYGTDNGQDYWIVKNSWGTSWGEQGYMRMVRNQNKCGIAVAASYPTV